MLWYSNLPCFDVHGVTSHLPHEKSILKACYWKGKNIPCAAIFYPIPTDRGMCCAFNMNPLNEIFNGETYVSLVIFRRNHPKESLYLKSILYTIKKGKIFFVSYYLENGGIQDIFFLCWSHYRASFSCNDFTLRFYRTMDTTLFFLSSKH